MESWKRRKRAREAQTKDETSSGNGWRGVILDALRRGVEENREAERTLTNNKQRKNTNMSELETLLGLRAQRTESRESKRPQGPTSVKLLALLGACGLGLESVSEITGIDSSVLRNLIESVDPDELKQLTRGYVTKLNRPMEEKLKAGAGLAVDRILSILASPSSNDKEVLNASKELLDRHLGKAVQRSEILNANLNIDADELQLKRDLEASNLRLKQLMEDREKVKGSLTAQGSSNASLLVSNKEAIIELPPETARPIPATVPNTKS